MTLHPRRTAPEEADIGGGAMPYASSSQMLMPIALRWALVWEAAPAPEASLWLCRATPRSWLVAGQQALAVKDAATSFGRLSFSIEVQAACSAGCGGGHCAVATIGLNRTAGHGLPSGGLVLRLRLPGRPPIKSAATGGGKTVPASWLNASSETVTFPEAELQKQTGSVEVVVCY